MDIQYKRFKLREENDTTWTIIDSQDLVVDKGLITIDDTKSICDVLIKEAGGEDINDNFEDFLRSFDRMTNYLVDLSDDTDDCEWGHLAAEQFEALSDIADGKMSHAEYLKKFKLKNTDQ